MKHIFIYNPAAGKDGATTITKLQQAMQAYGDRYDYEFYPTQAPGDATTFVRAYCESDPNTPLRFYACGGDGTANEVLHGIIGFGNASMTCYPCGSGNDYVKYYGGSKRFLDLDALLNATEVPVDVMRIGDRYSINVTNFGFDTAVARTMNNVRHKWLIGGKNAYTTGIVKALFTAMKNHCTVTVDGEVLNPDGKMLLCTVSNGRYVGGSFCCAPLSRNDDGLLEVCFVKPLSRLTFIKLVDVYKKGEHIGNPAFEKYVIYRQAKSVHVSAPKGFAYTLDGEIVECNDFTIDILPAAIRFAVPASPANSKNEQAQEEPQTV